MVEYRNVHGSMNTVPVVEIGVTTVYERSNIRRETVTDIYGTERQEWVYDEVQYSLDEWAAKTSDETYNALKALAGVL